MTDQVPPMDDEDDDGQLDDEDLGGHSEGVEPWDPSQIRISTKSLSLRDVVDQIVDGDIDLAPEFQREYVWKDRQRTRLIESILLGIPLPAFYFNQRPDGTYQVVDGVQRLSTIALFMQNKHALEAEHLEYLTDLNGQVYALLDGAALRRFRSTQIIVHVIEPQTPDEVKFDIFSRVNTLGSPLSSQEIRHAMSKQRSREFIKGLAECAEFDAATESRYWRRDKESGIRVRDSGRMANRELVLRFCAFRNFSVDSYREFESLDAYLIDFTRRLDGASEHPSPLSEAEMLALSSSLKRAMINAHAILDRAAFRRWPLSVDRRGPINRALFEAQGNALADYDLERLRPFQLDIQTAFRKAFEDPLYLRAVTVGTGDPRNVALRLGMTSEILRSVVQ
jgi:hypothetical protein